MFSLPIQPEALAGPLAAELSRALLTRAEADPAGPAAELLRAAVAAGVERHLSSLGLVPVETVAEALGWSVRRFRAEARQRGIPGAEADGPGLVRLEDVRAALDPGVNGGGRSAAFRELRDQVQNLGRAVARLAHGQAQGEERDRLLLTAEDALRRAGELALPLVLLDHPGSTGQGGKRRTAA